MSAQIKVKWRYLKGSNLELGQLVKGKLIKRYKRFLADVELENGETITAHCPNSGRMTTCWEEGWPVLLSHHDNPKRKLKYTWELVHNGETWICVNTHRANALVEEAIEADLIKELKGYDSIRREVKYAEKSRIDLLLEKETETCYVEVKTSTLMRDGKNEFPDAVTSRGLKHIHDLIEMKKQGHRAVLLFVVMREDGCDFDVAGDIDPAYAEAYEKAKDEGLEVLVYRTRITESSIELLAQD